MKKIGHLSKVLGFLDVKQQINVHSTGKNKFCPLLLASNKAKKCDEPVAFCNLWLNGSVEKIFANKGTYFTTYSSFYVNFHK